MQITKELGKKTLSIILAILMIVTTLPLSVFAIHLDSAEQPSLNNNSVNLIKNVYEVEDLREESVKHFRLEDGSYIAAQYDKPIHYHNVGKFNWGLVRIFCFNYISYNVKYT